MLGLTLYTGDLGQQSQLSRSSGSSADQKLAERTYVISPFVPLNLSDIRTRINNISQANQKDNAYVKSLKDIADAAQAVSTAPDSTYRPPLLLTTVDAKVFEEELVVNDF